MPQGSFWESKDLIPVAQKKVSVPAEFGLNYSAGQKIQICLLYTSDAADE